MPPIHPQSSPTGEPRHSSLRPEHHSLREAAEQHQAELAAASATPTQNANGQYEVLPPINNPNPTGHNPYEFIVNPTVKRTPNPLFRMTFGKQIGLMVGGLVIVLIVLAVVISSLAPKSSLPGLIAVAQRQQEIIRISTNATQQTTGQGTSNFVINTQLTLQSGQAQILGYLQGRGTKLGNKQLALDNDPKTDVTLTNAAAANDYDSTVTDTLTTQLGTYLALLQSTYKQTTSASAKKLLQQDFTATSDLLTQAKAVQSQLASGH